MCEQKNSGCCGKWLYPISFIFRIAGTGLAVGAAGVMATASQCTVYADYGSRPRTITYTDFPVFVYLVVASSIAVFLEAIALFLIVSKKVKCKTAWRVLMLLIAAVVTALLYTAAGAAFAVGWDISYYLEPSGRRFSVCHSSIGDRFCKQVHISMWLVLGAAVAVSIAEFLTAFQGCDGVGGSGSDSESECGHGCHCKH